jgi:hypothetical protein
MNDIQLHEKVINAMLNNIRYPNPVTFYFHSLLIMIFSEFNEDLAQELIVRNLFERMIIEKPHPWGILTFLYKILANANFKFEQKKFYTENEKFTDNMIQLAFRYARIKANGKPE